MAIVTYEEMVRVQRANGLRKDDPCLKQCGCTPYGTDEERFEGLSYEDVSKMPIPENRVCSHTKVIVPVSPTIVVEETVKTINVETKAAPYRVVDFNQCDGRDGVLSTIPKGVQTEIEHAETIEEHVITVEDNIHSDPYPVKTTKRKVQKTEVEQPLTVGSDTAEVQITENGKDTDTVTVSA